MKSISKSIHWILLIASLATIAGITGCASPKEKNERALKKEVGSTEWYAERERKRVTVVKDKKEKEAGYNRGQTKGVNPGTGLNIPKSDKK